MTALAPSTRGTRSFVHEAFFYEEERCYLDSTVTFVEDGLRRNEQVFLLVTQAHLELLRSGLGGPAKLARGKGRVHFLSIEALGRNPARIIPKMDELLTPFTKAGNPARAVCEALWVGRTEPELAECIHHDALVNLAFAEARNLAVRCPYDSRLSPAILAGARKDHPYLIDSGVSLPNRDYGHDVPLVPNQPLPAPPAGAEVFDYGAHSLAHVRGRVLAMAQANGVNADRTDDLVAAVGEAMANSVCHAGGHGTISLWFEGHRLVCEVRDSGNLGDPLVGRRKPSIEDTHGRGVWLMNQLCELVQIRPVPGGLAVRLHIDA